MYRKYLTENIIAVAAIAVAILAAPAICVAQSVPCISAGPIYEAPKGCHTCHVRNVSSKTYNVKIAMVNDQNASVIENPLATLEAGKTIKTGFCDESVFLTITCNVTTQTGTEAALQDLAVTEEFAPSNTASTAALAVGKVYQDCEPSGPSASGD
jgi:hypothetical protein